MRTIFDDTTRQELVDRIGKLSNDSRAQWGKMNVHQMVQHCLRSDDMMQGRLPVKRALAGKLFGRMVLRTVLKDEAPFRKNSPTARELMIDDTTTDLAKQKADWQARVLTYAQYSNNSLVHPFFGPLTREQIGQLVYKHYDHHLRQFGV